MHTVSFLRGSIVSGNVVKKHCDALKWKLSNKEKFVKRKENRKYFNY